MNLMERDRERIVRDSTLELRWDLVWKRWQKAKILRKAAIVDELSGHRGVDKQDFVPPRMVGATIVRIGSIDPDDPAYDEIEGQGGLVIDFVPKGQTKARRVVFAHTELGMWIESLTSAPAV